MTAPSLLECSNERPFEIAELETMAILLESEGESSLWTTQITDTIEQRPFAAIPVSQSQTMPAPQSQAVVASSAPISLLNDIDDVNNFNNHRHNNGSRVEMLEVADGWGPAINNNGPPLLITQNSTIALEDTDVIVEPAVPIEEQVAVQYEEQVAACEEESKYEFWTAIGRFSIEWGFKGNHKSCLPALTNTCGLDSFNCLMAFMFLNSSVAGSKLKSGNRHFQACMRLIANSDYAACRHYQLYNFPGLWKLHPKGVLYRDNCHAGPKMTEVNVWGNCDLLNKMLIGSKTRIKYSNLCYCLKRGNFEKKDAIEHGYHIDLPETKWNSLESLMVSMRCSPKVQCNSRPHTILLEHDKPTSKHCTQSRQKHESQMSHGCSGENYHYKWNMKINEFLVLMRQPTKPSASQRKSARIRKRQDRHSPSKGPDATQTHNRPQANFTQLENIREGFFESDSFTLRGTIMYGKGHYTTLMLSDETAVLQYGMGSVYSEPFDLMSPPQRVESMLETRETVLALYKKNVRPQQTRMKYVSTVVPTGKVISWEIVDVLLIDNQTQCSACDGCFAEGATALYSKSLHMQFHWRPNCFGTMLNRWKLNPEEVVQNIRDQPGF